MNGTANTAGLRDARGRFCRGNPGKPKGCGGAARLRRLFRLHVGEARFCELVDKLVSLALEGDVQALRLTFSYLLGRPENMGEMQHLEGMDQIDAEFEQLHEGADWRMLDDEDANDADDADGNDCGFVSADEMLANLPQESLGD